MNTTDILEKTKKLINESRHDEHGDKLINHENISNPNNKSGISKRWYSMILQAWPIVMEYELNTVPMVSSSYTPTIDGVYINDTPNTKRVYIVNTDPKKYMM